VHELLGVDCAAGEVVRILSERCWWFVATPLDGLTTHACFLW